MQAFKLFSLLLLATPLAMAQDALLETSDKLAEETEQVLADPPDFVTLEISEWPVPWEDTRPRDPDVAPNGSIWLVGQGGDYVAHFDPESLEFARKDLPPGTGPHNLIVDGDASIWIAGNRQRYIGKMNPNTGELVRFTMPDEALKDPHTMVFDSSGHIWFTAQWSNFIGRLNKRSGAVDLIQVPIEKARPYGINLDSNGIPWVALLGTNRLFVAPRGLDLLTSACLQEAIAATLASATVVAALQRTASSIDYAGGPEATADLQTMAPMLPVLEESVVLASRASRLTEPLADVRSRSGDPRILVKRSSRATNAFSPLGTPPTRPRRRERPPARSSTPAWYGAAAGLAR